ncbi:uncharacterized protein LOC129765173 isoform X2 [Toxorhynchites rutilus septentrionalis]|uniref:uncharacterized protein LOC129765173 isoform X2 n=1 Tax=Toxorhynchites rutilus septentrionalis TaxID=329112 RepID=UPI0024783C80|nr:uncharacterized protein LOC129765173 isoform X2 [Toxorhynchites rutilus septentrionalis]
MSNKAFPHLKSMSSLTSFESCKHLHSKTGKNESMSSAPSSTKHHREMLQENTLHIIHSRLLEIDSKMTRVESDFHDSFARLEANIKKCYQSIQRVSEILATTGWEREDATQDLVVNVKLGNKEYRYVKAEEVAAAMRNDSLAAEILNDRSASPERKPSEKHRRSRVLSKIKDGVKNVYRAS